VEDYFAKIDAWKKRKDEAERQAVLREKQELEEAQRELRDNWLTIKKVCDLADKCREVGIPLEGRDLLVHGSWRIGLALKCVRGDGRADDYRHYLAVSMSDASEVIVTENGAIRVPNCMRLKLDETKELTAFIVREVVEKVPGFIEKFYRELDKILN